METYQNELKLINTPEKAYLLGFIYGDGCISQYMDGKRLRHQTRISIHVKDSQLIENLNKLFPFLKISEFDYSIYNKNFGKQISLNCYSKQLFDDLSANGLFIRKSYENKENLKLPNLPDYLLSHFIRGFFDADGSVFICKTIKNTIRVSITSNSKNFMYGLDSYLRKFGINSWKVVEHKIRGKGKQITYDLAINKRNEVLSFKEFIYKNSTIHLERKKKIFDDFKGINKVVNRNIACNQCGSLNTIKSGYRKRKYNIGIRMKCIDCNKGFTLK